MEDSCSGTFEKEASGTCGAQSAHPTDSPGNPGYMKVAPSQVWSIPGCWSALGHPVVGPPAKQALP